MIERCYYDNNNNLIGFYETLYINTYTEYLQYSSNLIIYKLLKYWITNVALGSKQVK